MPVNHLVQSFGPDELKVLGTAFDAALQELGLDRTDPTALLLAKWIIVLAQRGERDPIRLREDAVKGLRQLLAALRVANAP
jgi:hypothetical protein